MMSAKSSQTSCTLFGPKDQFMEHLLKELQLSIIYKGKFTEFCRFIDQKLAIKTLKT